MAITALSIPEPLMALWATAEQRFGTQRSIAVINFIALAIFVNSLANWTWQFAQPKLTPIIAQPIGTAESAERNIDLRSLLNANLFGVAEIPADNGTKTPDQVPLSSLNLLLTGVVAAGEESIALISVAGQPQTPFIIGEEVAHGAVLDAVYPDRAILQRAGILESLVLNDANDTLLETVEPDSPTTATATIGDIRSLGSNSYAFPRQLIQQQLRNPKFLGQAQIVPRKDGGGFLVKRLQGGSVYQKLGLRQGDIIESIDGQSISSAQDAMSHYQKLSSAGSVQVGIVRNGAAKILQFTLE